MYSVLLFILSLCISVKTDQGLKCFECQGLDIKTNDTSMRAILDSLGTNTDCVTLTNPDVNITDCFTSDTGMVAMCNVIYSYVNSTELGVNYIVKSSNRSCAIVPAGTQDTCFQQDVAAPLSGFSGTNMTYNCYCSTNKCNGNTVIPGSIQIENTEPSISCFECDGGNGDIGNATLQPIFESLFTHLDCAIPNVQALTLVPCYTFEPGKVAKCNLVSTLVHGSIDDVPYVIKYSTRGCKIVPEETENKCFERDTDSAIIETLGDQIHKSHECYCSTDKCNGRTVQDWTVIQNNTGTQEDDKGNTGLVPYACGMLSIVVPLMTTSLLH